MDIYVSPKIKATVKSVGTIILLLFYSSLVDFYYIGPYIHNTLSQIKYTTEKMLVNGKDIENNFYDMNVMLYDTISFFNGLNRSFVKDLENFLKTNVVFNERLFLNLRGLYNSDEIMNMCRDYSGGQKYVEVIKSGKIKPKIKSKENINKNPKNDEKIKIEGDESSMFRFLKFKKKVKKKMFLDEDFNMIDFPEYIDDYERTFLKMDFEETAKIITPESNMLEIYDFINNIIITDKDKQAINKKKTMNLSKDNKNTATDNKNDLPDILSMFAIEDKDKNKKENENINKKEEGKKKENNSNDLLFDFSKSLNNENKDDKGKTVGVDSLFDFLPNLNKESNKESNLSKIENKEDTNKNQDNKQSDQNKNNENLFDFVNFQKSNQNNAENQKQKNNDDENQKQKNNDENSFDFSNIQKSKQKNNDDENQKQKNNDEISFDFSNFQKSNKKNDENKNKKNNNANSFEFNIQKSNQKNEENKEQNNNNNNKKEKENESPGLIGNSLDNTANKRGTKTSEKNKNNNFINNGNESNKKDNFNQKKNNGNQNKPLFNFNINNNNNTRSSFNNNNGFNFNNANQSNQQFFSSFNQNPINKSSDFGFGDFGFNKSSNNFGFFQQKDEEKIKVELEEKNWFYLNLQKQENIINIKNEGSLGLICDKEINKNKNFKMEFLFENFNNSQYIQTISLLKPEKIGEFTYMINLNKLKKSQQLLKYQLNGNILANKNILQPRIYPNNNELKFGFIYNNYIQKTIKTIDLFVNYNNFLQDYKNIETDGKIKEESSLQLHLSYEGKINEANIKYPEATMIGPLVKQITIQVALEDDVMSDFNVEIIDIENQESLQIVKSCQIFYDFSYLYS